MNHRLAIVNVNDVTGTVTLVKDHGNMTVAEYDTFLAECAQKWQAFLDYNELLDGIIDFCFSQGVISTDGKIGANWSFESYLKLVQDNIDKITKHQEGPKKGSYKEGIGGVSKIAIASIKGWPVGKGVARINIDQQAIVTMIGRINEPATRLLLSDPGRRERLRPLMQAQVMLYENPPSPN